MRSLSFLFALSAVACGSDGGLVVVPQPATVIPSPDPMPVTPTAVTPTPATPTPVTPTPATPTPVTPTPVTPTPVTPTPTDPPTPTDVPTPTPTSPPTPVVMPTPVPVPPPTPVLLPDIEVAPNTVAFPYAVSGQLGEFLTLMNVGEADLDVSSISINSNVFSYQGQTAFTLAPGGSVPLTVLYDANGMQNQAPLVILSNDPVDATLNVPVVSGGGEPDLVILPALMEFGLRDLTCPAEDEAVLENIGNLPLTVTDIQLANASGSLVLTLPGLPLTLQPGETAPLPVDYISQVLGDNGGTVTVVSNDPDGDEIMNITGTGRVRQGAGSTIAPDSVPVDIIFLVDQSGSMGPYQQALGNNIQSFISGLPTVSADWRIMAVTRRHGRMNDEFANNAKFATSTTLTQADFLDSISSSENQDEDLFRWAGNMFDETLPGGDNVGLIRPNSIVHLVMITDEEEQSPGNSNWGTVNGAINDFLGHLTPDNRLIISSVSNQSQCTNPNGSEFSGFRYADAGVVSSGIVADICTGNWANDLADIAQISQRRILMQLSTSPQPGTVAVTEDGLPYANWTFDQTSLLVEVFDAMPGSTVEVVFDLPPVCPP